MTELAVGFLSLVEQLDVFDSMQGFLAWICIDATVVQGISDRLGETSKNLKSLCSDPLSNMLISIPLADYYHKKCP